MPPIELDLERDVQDGAVRRIYQDFRVALVGAVQNFKRETTRATLELMTRFRATDGKVHDEKPVTDVPLIMQSGDGYGFWHDVTERDLAVVLCCDGPVRGVFESGSAVTPTSAASHTFGCAVAFPGGRVSSTGAPTAPPNAKGEALLGGGDATSCVVFRRAGGPSPAEQGTIVLHAAGPVASVRAGSDSAATPVACAPQTAANFALVASVIQGLPDVPGDPGIIAALKTAFGVGYTGQLQDVADKKLVVEGPGP